LPPTAAGRPNVALRVLCAGAAQGLVTALQQAFRVDTGANLEVTFGAVGALEEKLLAGERCDVVILTAAMIGDLERERRVLPGASAPLGRVRTGIAVRAGTALPRISDGAQLRDTLLAATGIYVPDTQRSTAGIHFAQVLARLGIYDDVAPRLRLYPNGASAMRELASATESGPVGCTQITEIRYAAGVALAGPLPAGFELATVYAVAVCADALLPDLARRFAALLSGPAAQGLRTNSGFE
jgi:molybdate transport system substrate-binding protein